MPSDGEVCCHLPPQNIRRLPPARSTFTPCAYRSRRRHGKSKFTYVIIILFFVGKFIHPFNYQRQSIADNISLKRTPPQTSYAKRKRHRNRQQAPSITNDQNKTFPQMKIQQQQHLNTSAGISSSPLFYHVSPGSTGSRTLYHAACTSGFPSVHHKSFCISQTQGISAVDENVVRGVRSHYEILRLYQMASDCCSLWSKGKIQSPHDDWDVVALDSGNNRTMPTMAKQLCYTPLDKWAAGIQTHLSVVIQSGLVGLFDTPYPYLAQQILVLADNWRSTSPIIAMTERDPSVWAKSRTKNHGLLLCQEEYSYGKLGASEFDLIGCVDRANRDSLEGNADQSPGSGVLHFWDAFHYRSHKKEIDPSFQMGMERQMEYHQELYLPLARYAPDMFGVHSPTHSESTPIQEKEVATDISRHILDGKHAKHGIGSNTTEPEQSSWRKRYTQSLTCRGRVNWHMKNDTLVEYYHLPKTCNAKKEKDDFRMIPLV